MNKLSLELKIQLIRKTTCESVKLLSCRYGRTAKFDSCSYYGHSICKAGPLTQKHVATMSLMLLDVSAIHVHVISHVDHEKEGCMGFYFYACMSRAENGSEPA